MEDFNSFIKPFDSSFWRVLRQSIVPFEDKPKDKEVFLADLYKSIKECTYSPGNPREYILSDKHNGAIRVVPTFNYKDSCTYYYCIKNIEEFIATQRVEGTFGGWQLGTPIRELEENEEPQGVSAPTNSFNRKAWGENWKEFQKKAYEYSQLDDYEYFIKVDIANFYDSINLITLERKLRALIPKNKCHILDLLFTFLKGWNKRFEGYAEKTVGIPQDEIGDCSRILANFFLQDYDQRIYELCRENDCKYLRFADDQLIMAKNKRSADIILSHTSKELFKINLYLNSAKISRIKSKDDFNNYWCFELFDLLAEKNNKDNINKAVKLFFEMSEKDKLFIKHSALRRILNVNFKLIEAPLRYKLFAMIYEEYFLSNTDIWYMNKIAKNTDDKEELYNNLDNLAQTCLHNAFHYNLLKFNKRWRPDKDN
ncbi:hypothetical protein COX08_00915, partial [Candidatus Beckwithbacteria bacterium CG23_combo_of_CG06-09_8_20_14_all_34_8]